MQALILVDLQNDFMPGGSLAVAEGDATVAVANRLLPLFELVVATQDWHPADHQSFASQHPGRKVGDEIDLDGLQQILWPDHCVQNTSGADFHAELNLAGVKHVIHKGTDRNIDSYSGFFDNGHRQATGLADLLTAHKVTEVFLLGLATDYCVKFTALDAVMLGFKTRLVADACRGVELQAGDVAQAVAAMRAAGVKITNSQEIIDGRAT